MAEPKTARRDMMRRIRKNAELNNTEVGSLAYDIAQENKLLFKAPY